MAEVDWSILGRPPGVDFKPYPGGVAGGIVQGYSAGAQAQEANASADYKRARIPLEQQQTQMAQEELNMKKEMQPTEMAYRQAMTQSAQSAVAIQNMQMEVSKAGLAKDMIATVTDQKSMNRVMKNLDKMGIDTSGIDSKYDPATVAQYQAMSEHYVKIMERQSAVQFQKLGMVMQMSQANAQAMQMGMQPPYPQLLNGQMDIQSLMNSKGIAPQNGQSMNSDVQQPTMNQAMPSGPQEPMRSPMTQEQEMPSQAPQSPMMQGANIPSTPLQGRNQSMPQQAPMQSLGPTSPLGQGRPMQQSQSPAMQSITPQGMPNPAGAMGAPPSIAAPPRQSFPEALSGAKQAGEAGASSAQKFEDEIIGSAKNANSLLIDIAQARDAVNTGITTGRYTGPLRQLINPSASDQLQKATANLFSNQLKSLGGSGIGRVLQSEANMLLKGLPQNTTQKEVNHIILDTLEMGAKLSQLNAQALQQLKSMGITDPLQQQNILIQTYDQLNLLNTQNGHVNKDNLRYYYEALNATVQGKPLINEQTIQETAQARGMSPEQVKAELKKRGLLGDNN